MSKEKVGFPKFFTVKLFLILFAAAAGALAAFFLSLTMPAESGGAFRTVLLGTVPTVIFFAFIYSFAAKIKVPDKEELSPRYFAAFTVKETVVYAVFLIPVHIAAALLGKGFTDGASIGACLILPHVPAFTFGAHLAVNYVFCTAIYAAVSFVAHYLNSKKHTPDKGAPEADGTITEAAADTADEASDNDDKDDKDDNDDNDETDD